MNHGFNPSAGFWFSPKFTFEALASLAFGTVEKLSSSFQTWKQGDRMSLCEKKRQKFNPTHILSH
jgi:hypothetical protein